MVGAHFPLVRGAPPDQGVVGVDLVPLSKYKWRSIQQVGLRALFGGSMTWLGGMSTLLRQLEEARTNNPA
jgi:hypothetical protein